MLFSNKWPQLHHQGLWMPGGGGGGGKCIIKCVVYKATVTETTSNNQETYIGLTENEFKTRFNLHKSSFKLEHQRTSTTLTDHVWKLKKKISTSILHGRWSKE